MIKFGCHVSIQGGVDKAPEVAHKLGCEVMQIFTRSPQGGTSSVLSEKLIKNFKTECKKYKIKEVYVHTPYYINLASTNNKIRYGSINAIKTELERANLLGAKYVMTHLGSAKDLDKNEAIEKTIDGLKKVFDGYKGKTKLIIENSAGAGKIIGDNFEDINKILKAVKNKNLAGICLDTQHGFASGYDWLTLKIKNIKLIHANDSMTDCGSHKDRHEHIGKGKIGIKKFENIVKFAKKNKINLICETNYPGVINDIKILKKLSK